MSQRDVGGEARLGSDHARRALGVIGGSSARGWGRRCLSGRCMMFQRAASLNMARGSSETNRTLVQEAVDVNVSEFPALEAGFMVSGMITDEGCIMVTADPPDFCVFKGGLFVFG